MQSSTVNSKNINYYSSYHKPNHNKTPGSLHWYPEEEDDHHGFAVGGLFGMICGIVIIIVLCVCIGWLCHMKKSKEDIMPLVVE